MNLFKIVKESVTVKQTAALYGLPVTTTWMTRCPFHEDHTKLFSAMVSFSPKMAG